MVGSLWSIRVVGGGNALMCLQTAIKQKEEEEHGRCVCCYSAEGRYVFSAFQCLMCLKRCKTVVLPPRVLILKAFCVSNVKQMWIIAECNCNGVRPVQIN